jgi:hypothetical protein
MLAVVQALVAGGIPVESINLVLQQQHGFGSNTMRSAPGYLEREAFINAVLAEGKTTQQTLLSRFFTDTNNCSMMMLVHTR